MGTIRVEATPADGLGEFRFQLDDHRQNIRMLPQEGTDPPVYIGTDDVEGACGDGSLHRLYYTLVGPIGSILRLKIFCDDTLRKSITLEIYGPAAVVHANVRFRL
ncbi:MAG TPA: hypothetical protein VF603_07050 [Allosphingosinicella sp.]